MAMVWQFLNTREKQNKIFKVGIKDFFIVTNVLHVHMKRKAVMRTEFDYRLLEIEKVCKLTAKKAKKGRTTAVKAKQVAEKVKK